jgi:predicted metal-dependent peptidase
MMAMAEEDASIIPALGLIRDPCYRVFFCVDTSGSMNEESLRIAASELTHLLRADEDMEVRYIQGDADVHYDKVFHSGDTIPGDVVGRGGTDFDAYFQHMAQYVRDDETCPDLVIVYTDGYAPEVAHHNKLPPDIPVIWLLTPRGSPPENYGEVITCDPSHNNLYTEE